LKVNSHHRLEDKLERSIDISGVLASSLRPSYLHFHRLKDALALVAGPLAFLTTPFIRAQNEL
jgi:hypothetical protein